MQIRRALSITFPLFVALAALAPRQLDATTLARMSLAQMARAADTIVRARCVGSSSQWQQGSIWTISDFEVVETFKGAPPARIQVRVPGGRVGHVSMNVEAAPKFQPAEEGVLFLEKTAAGDYSVTSWAQGTFRIRKGAQRGRETVTQDSSTFHVFDSNTLLFRSEGVRNLSLDQFRARLALAMTQSSGASRQ